MNTKDLTGKRFGRLIVIKDTGERKNNYINWMCKCDCGKISKIVTGNLASGHTRSCGCLNKEMTIKRSTTHGMSRTRPYDIWCGMIKRCLNPKAEDYKNYGGRGIKVCERWNKFDNFWEDMKSDYSDNLTIDRIDNNGNYEPSNCKWSTMKEQNNNRRDNIIIKYQGKKNTISEWATIKNTTYTTLFLRLRRGWTIERTLTT
jgi:hypothetical protein